MTEKTTKSDADYSKGMAARHCGKMFDKDVGYCAHFIGEGITAPGKCERVYGDINRNMWCRLFKKAVTK